jgi:hypothetical protein
MSSFTLVIDDLEHGWARAAISCGAERLTLYPSYISDRVTV